MCRTGSRPGHIRRPTSYFLWDKYTGTHTYFIYNEGSLTVEKERVSNLPCESCERGVNTNKIVNCEGLS